LDLQLIPLTCNVGSKSILIGFLSLCHIPAIFKTKLQTSQEKRCQKLMLKYPGEIPLGASTHWWQLRGHLLENAEEVHQGWPCLQPSLLHTHVDLRMLPGMPGYIFQVLHRVFGQPDFFPPEFGPG
jgi:hypothetical protein